MGRILDYLAVNPLDYEGHELFCRFSYGIAFYPDDGRDYTTLLNRADRNMYAMKRRRKTSTA